MLLLFEKVFSERTQDLKSIFVNWIMQTIFKQLQASYLIDKSGFNNIRYHII